MNQVSAPVRIVALVGLLAAAGVGLYTFMQGTAGSAGGGGSTGLSTLRPVQEAKGVAARLSAHNVATARGKLATPARTGAKPTQPVPVGEPFSAQCAKKSAFKGKQAKMSGHPVKIGCIWQPYDATHPAAFAPSAQGGADWNPAAYNPSTHLMYVCAADSDIAQLGIPAAKQTADYLAGKTFFGIVFGGFHFYRGFVKAMDVTTNKVAWTATYKSPCYSGTFTSAGNLVFAGQVNGEYDAFDATTGQKLWSSKLDAGVAAPGMTYSVNGKQYVAIYAGGSTFAFEATVTGEKFPHGDSVYAFALP